MRVLRFALALASLLLWSPPALADEADFKRVRAALECRPDARQFCATRQDELAEVEDAHPKVRVVHTRREEKHLLATVLRTPDAPENGVFFQYVLDEKGKVRSRTCVSTIPEEGAALERAHKAWGMDGDRLVFVDRCSIRGSCRKKIGRRVSFFLGRDGKLSDAREIGGMQLEGEDEEGCLFLRQELPLPTLSTRVEGLRGWALGVGADGKTQALKVGQELDAERVYLGFYATLRLDVGGIPVELRAEEEGLLLHVHRDPKLDGGWRRVAAEILPDRPKTRPQWHWSPPYLVHEELVLRLGQDQVETACEDASLAQQCLLGSCRRLRKEGAPFVDPAGVVFLPGPGAILVGICRQESRVVLEEAQLVTGDRAAMAVIEPVLKSQTGDLSVRSLLRPNPYSRRMHWRVRARLHIENEGITALEILEVPRGSERNIGELVRAMASSRPWKFPKLVDPTVVEVTWKYDP